MSFDGNRLSHAYIASGSLAEKLAMAVVCSEKGSRPCLECRHCGKSSQGAHPDIIVVKKQDGKREHLIEQMRELKKDVIIVPNEAAKKAYVIDDASSMNVSSQNALLRILEEPPVHAVFILKTDTPDELIETVRSRCVELKSEVSGGIRDSESRDAANGYFAAAQSGNLALAEYMYKLEKLDKEQFAAFLTAAREHASAELRKLAGGGDIESREMFSCAERILLKAEEYLDLNVSAGHISGMICAEMMSEKRC